MPCLTSYNTPKTLYSNPDLLHGFRCLKCLYSLVGLSYSDPFPDTGVPCSPPCTSERQPDSFTTSRSQVRQNVLRRDVIISPCRMLEFCQCAQVKTFTELQSAYIFTCARVLLLLPPWAVSACTALGLWHAKGAHTRLNGLIIPSPPPTSAGPEIGLLSSSFAHTPQSSNSRGHGTEAGLTPRMQDPS